MRLVLTGAVACALVGCASSSTRDDTQPLSRACTVSKCFFERDIRSFEVIDKTTVIVYVGAQRCPFQIKLQGFACDMTFAPFLAFHPRNPILESGRDVFGQPVAAGMPSSSGSSNLRVCSDDNFGVDGGVFSENAEDVSTQSPRSIQPSRRREPGDLRADQPLTRGQCEIMSIDSMTDDQLVDLLVNKKGLPPPPPLGKPEIQAPAEQNGPADGAAPQQAAPEQGSAEQGATEPETGLTKNELER